MVLSYHSMFRSLCSCSVPFRSVPFLTVAHCLVYSFIHWLSLFGVWSVCPFGIPGTTELIYLNPRNIPIPHPIPRYHRLSVGTGVLKRSFSTSARKSTKVSSFGVTSPSLTSLQWQHINLRSKEWESGSYDRAAAMRCRVLWRHLRRRLVLSTQDT